MTYKSHLTNFCYLTYLHLNFSIFTIIFSHAVSRLKTLSFFYFSTPLFVYLFYITLPFALIAKKIVSEAKKTLTILRSVFYLLLLLI